ncbi:hypothetical protein J6590_051976 [Homalodisca vitripennis]|nr:hypothetical protein J6590_051976 [Homalodisca vitripennis]
MATPGYLRESGDYEKFLCIGDKHRHDQLTFLYAYVVILSRKDTNRELKSFDQSTSENSLRSPKNFPIIWSKTRPFSLSCTAGRVGGDVATTPGNSDGGAVFDDLTWHNCLQNKVGPCNTLLPNCLMQAPPPPPSVSLCADVADCPKLQRSKIGSSTIK